MIKNNEDLEKIKEEIKEQNQIEVKSKEMQIVTLKDFKQWEKIMREYRCGDVFW